MRREAAGHTDSSLAEGLEHIAGREQQRADKFWALKAHFALGTSRQCQDMTVTASGQNNHLGRGDIPFKAGNDRLKGRAVDLAFGRSTVMDFVVNVVQFSH